MAKRNKVLHPSNYLGGPGAVADACSIRNNGVGIDAHTMNLRGREQTINAVFFSQTADEDTRGWWLNNGGLSTGDTELDGIIVDHSNAAQAEPFKFGSRWLD